MIQRRELPTDWQSVGFDSTGWRRGPLGVGFEEIPGGLGVPADITQLWLRGDALALADGSRLSRWEDSSPQGNSVTQTVTSLQPTFENEEGEALNGSPIVRFAGDAFDSITFRFQPPPFAGYFIDPNNTTWTVN